MPIICSWRCILSYASMIVLRLLSTVAVQDAAGGLLTIANDFGQEGEHAPAPRAGHQVGRAGTLGRVAPCSWARPAQHPFLAAIRAGRLAFQGRGLQSVQAAPRVLGPAVGACSVSDCDESLQECTARMPY